MSRGPQLKSLVAIASAAFLAFILGACGSSSNTSTNTSKVTKAIAETSPSAIAPRTAPRNTTTATKTGSPKDGPTLGLGNFISPTGNIACLLDSKSVRCDIDKKDWTMRKPSGCDLDYGYGATVTATGSRGEVLCAGDTLMGSTSRDLPYGSNTVVGKMTCRSRIEGVTCTNAQGHGFFLSRGSYRLF